jgi:hypothetical protein
MRDCLLPAALWPTLHRLDAGDRLVALALWAAADRDGIAPLDPDLDVIVDATLHVAGFGTVYQDGLAFAEGRRWVWIPDVAVYAPPQPLRRPVEDGWPAPPPDAVRALLARRLGRDPTEAECRQACPRAYGKRRAAAPPMGDHVDRVYRAWKVGQAAKDGTPLDLPEGPSPIQRRMIQGAMKEAAKDPAEAADALILIFQYVYGADEKPAEYLRGKNNTGRAYLGLDNLTVTAKVQSRLAYARAWVGTRPPPTPDGAPAEDGVDLGPLARFR